MRQLLIYTLFLLISNCAYAGTEFTQLSKTINYIQLEKIANQAREAKRLSQKGLSKEELDKIKAKADEVLSQGAMVITSSQVIENDNIK